MGMKGLRVSCGDNFMSVVRKKDGHELGRVWWLKEKTEDGKYRLECALIRSETEHACGNMPDAEVLRLVQNDLSYRRMKAGEALDEWLEDIIECERLSCELILLGESEDA